MRAYSVPINGVDAVIVLTGMSFIFISFAIRVFIFMRLSTDSVIEKQLSNASIIGFGDFLALRLWRLRHNMSARAKFLVVAINGVRYIYRTASKLRPLLYAMLVACICAKTGRPAVQHCLPHKRPES